MSPPPCFQSFIICCSLILWLAKGLLCLSSWFAEHQKKVQHFSKVFSNFSCDHDCLPDWPPTCGLLKRLLLRSERLLCVPGLQEWQEWLLSTLLTSPLRTSVPGCIQARWPRYERQSVVTNPRPVDHRCVANSEAFMLPTCMFISVSVKKETQFQYAWKIVWEWIFCPGKWSAYNKAFFIFMFIYCLPFYALEVGETVLFFHGFGCFLKWCYNVLNKNTSLEI